MVVTHSRPANLNSISPSVFTAPWRRANLFPRVFYTAFRLSGESSSPFSEWSYPTQTRHPSSTGHFHFSYSNILFLFTRPVKMEQTGCSETSAHKIWMLGNHPKERIQHSQHDQSLQSRKIFNPSMVRGGLISNYCPRRRRCELVVPLNAITTVRCTEAGCIWRIKGPYIAPRPAVKV